MRKSILRLTFCMGILFLSAAGGILWTHQAARLDLSNGDDFHTAGKSIGMIPASREIYAAGVGLVDQTLFYQAVVTPMKSPGWRRLQQWTASQPPTSFPTRHLLTDILPCPSDPPHHSRNFLPIMPEPDSVRNIPSDPLIPTRYPPPSRQICRTMKGTSH